MVEDMKRYVMKRNLPQCKQLIKDFVKEVTVCRHHVEVKFNMAFFDGKITWELFRILKINKIKFE